MPDAAPDDNLVDLANLARDIAIEYLGLPQILRMHEITDEQWAVISVNPQFVAMAGQMKRDWESAANVKERVRMKAATAVEALMPKMLEEIVDPRVSATAKNDIYKTLMKLGELEQTQADISAGGDRFQFTINFAPGIAAPVTIDVTPTKTDAKAIEEKTA